MALAQVNWRDIDAMIAGADATTQLAIYTSRTEPTCVRNPNLWWPVNLTCVPVSNSGDANNKLGSCWITPDVLISSAHQWGWSYSAGDVQDFNQDFRAVGPLNQYASASSTKAVKVGMDYLLIKCVAPAFVTPAYMLPGDYLDWLDIPGGTPVIRLNQFGEATIWEIPDGGEGSLVAPTDLHRLQFWRDKTNGDSGYPDFHSIYRRVVYRATVQPEYVITAADIASSLTLLGSSYSPKTIMPITAQLQRSAHGAGSFSNVVGATTMPFTDTGLTTGSYYDYRVSYTDTTPTTVYSDVIVARTCDASPRSRLTSGTLRRGPGRLLNY